MVDSNKSKNLIYKATLTEIGFPNLVRTMIWCSVFDLKTLNDSENFLFTGTIFHNFKPEFIMDSVTTKTVAT